MKLSNVFAWTVLTLSSAVFFVVAAWGVQNSLLTAAVSSAVYTSVLFMAAVFLQRRGSHGDGATSDSKADSDSRVTSLYTMKSLFYALGTLSAGLTTLLVSASFGNCGSNAVTESLFADSSGKWTVNMSSIPSEVADWANRKDFSESNRAEFAYLPAADTIFFSGRDEQDDIPRLWMKVQEGNAAPQALSDITCPANLVVLEDGETVCLTGADVVPRQGDNAHLCDPVDSGFLTCTKPDGHHSILKAANPRELMVDKTVQGRIWYKTDPPSGFTSDHGNSGNLVYSVDVGSFLTETLHSYQEKVPPDASHCPNKVTLLLSPVLVVVLSIIIYWTTGTPSMPVCTYVGFTGLVVGLYYVFNPTHSDGIRNMIGWWFAVSSSFCLLGLNLPIKRLDEGTRRGGMSAAGLFFFVGTIMIFRFFATGSNSLWRCILMTIFCFLPLIALGTVTSNVFLLRLGATGMLLNVWAISMQLSGLLHKNVFYAVQFFAMAFAGLGLGTLVVTLPKKNQCRENIVDILVGKMGRSSGKSESNKTANQTDLDTDTELTLGEMT